MSLVKRLWNNFQIWYGFKEPPEPFQWERYPETEKLPVAPPALPVVQVQPVRPLSIRERAKFRPVHLLRDDSWLNSAPTTGPISISDIPTKPVVERDTEVTIKVPSIAKLLHERRNK